MSVRVSAGSASRKGGAVDSGAPLFREVELAAIPDDSRGLSLALTADELLREIDIEGQAAAEAAAALSPDPLAPARFATPERPSRAPDAPPWPGLVRIALAAAGEHHTAGLTFAGADGLVAWFPSAHLGLELALGGRHGYRRRSQHGAIDTAVIDASAAGLWSPWARGRDSALVLQLGLALAALRMTGFPKRDGSADRASAPSVHAFVGVGVRQRLLGPLELGLDAGLGAPLLRVRATDDGQVVMGTGGVQLRGRLALGVRL